MTTPDSASPTTDEPPKLDQTDASSTTSLTKLAKPQASNKIRVLLKPTGDAPKLNKEIWVLDLSHKVSYIHKFLRKYIKLSDGVSLFLYINQTFAPALDQTVKNLFDCFESDGKLVIYYATSQAWG